MACARREPCTHAWRLDPYGGDREGA
jgi:hypothetical protein